MPVAGVVLAAVGGAAPSSAARSAAAGGGPLLLVLRALGLGDLLTAVPALRALRAAHPEHRIVLAAPDGLARLAELTGAVDDVVDTAPLVPLHPSLVGAAAAVNLHGSGPQSHRVLLSSRPHELVAFEHAEVPESRGGPRWRPNEHEVARWCRLLSESGIPADPRRLDLDAPPLAGPARVAADATLIHPGAASGARRWPAERFAAVARAERAAGRTVMITGSASEAELAGRVARAADLGDDAVLAGRTDLRGLAAVVGAAARVVCGDTGVAHLATALRTPSVVLFGPTSPAHWGPPADRPWHRVLWAGTVGDPHAAEVDPGLARITVDDALAALRGLPPGPGTAARPALAAAR